MRRRILSRLGMPLINHCHPVRVMRSLPVSNRGDGVTSTHGSGDEFVEPRAGNSGGGFVLSPRSRRARSPSVSAHSDALLAVHILDNIPLSIACFARSNTPSATCTRADAGRRSEAAETWIVFPSPHPYKPHPYRSRFPVRSIGPVHRSSPTRCSRLRRLEPVALRGGLPTAGASFSTVAWSGSRAPKRESAWPVR
jgi:hypothetical protein